MVADNHDQQYKLLQKVLASAYAQAAYGKGTQRHVNKPIPFDEQISMWIQKQGFDFARGQAVKKIHESLRMTPEMAIVELMGAINYCAMAIIDLSEGV